MSFKIASPLLCMCGGFMGKHLSHLCEPLKNLSFEKGHIMEVWVDWIKILKKISKLNGNKFILNVSLT